MKTVLLRLILTISYLVVINESTPAQTGPAGVGNTSTNKIWLDAASLTGLSNGSRASSWVDRSGNGWNANQSNINNRPLFFTNQLNGNPVLRFDRTNATQFLEITAAGIGATISNSNSIFAVSKTTSGGKDATTNYSQYVISAHSNSNGFTGIRFAGLLGGSGSTITNNLIVGQAMNNETNLSVYYADDVTKDKWYIAFQGSIGTTTTMVKGYANGLLTGQASNSYPMQSSTLLRIGTRTSSGYWSCPFNGDIAEIIVYNTALNEAQRVIVENYLSAKYNLTISSDKYTLNDPNYIRDVEGIGTTDGTNANKHSISSNSKGLKLTELNSSLDGGGEFLFAGHASNSNTIINTELPPSVSERWQRVWYVEKTGSMDAKLSFDISDAGLTVPINLATEFAYYQLLYRSSASGAFAAVPVSPALENGDQITFTLTNDQLSNGYYSLGTSNGIVWSGAIDQQWSVAGNWNLNRIPTASDRVIVNGCTTCPVLNGAVTIAALTLNNGSRLNLAHEVLVVTGAINLNEAHIESDQGTFQSADFLEVKNSVFQGPIVLEKTGGVDNTWYGGNTFSPELKIINSSSNSWQVASQSDNLIKTF